MNKRNNNVYDYAIELYNSGLSLSKVAELISVTRQCVYKAFKLRGLKLRTMNDRPVKYFDGKKFTLRDSGYYSLTIGYRTLMHRYVWEFYNGEIPYNYDIHHIDEDRTNNVLSNLECLPKAEHTRKYSPHNNQYTRGRKSVTH